MRHYLLPLSLILLFFTLSGCATLPRNPVPLDKLYEAEVLGIPHVRAWGGLLSAGFEEDIVTSVKQEGPGGFINPETGKKSYSGLALSGGGGNGSFGAGFLYGWSKRGDRPVFKLVTGISTGALIAPFAFLGTEYDEVLKKLYTTVSTKQIINILGFLKILTASESFAASTPLRNLIETHIDDLTLLQIAKAHDEGRRLYIGTTHMDAQRLAVWNMGLIAKEGTPEALSLFHDIMLASASIPAAMPPVYIKVKVDGIEYDEMHTDGGTVTQVFFHAGTMNLAEAGKLAGYTHEKTGFARLYIIRNGQINPSPEQVLRKLPDISSRALETTVKTAALNNLFRMYVFARKENSEFFYVDIPDSFVSQAKEAFDQEEMIRLFEIGMQMSLSDDPWNKAPPGFELDM